MVADVPLFCQWQFCALVHQKPFVGGHAQLVTDISQSHRSASRDPRHCFQLCKRHPGRVRNAPLEHLQIIVSILQTRLHAVDGT